MPIDYTQYPQPADVQQLLTAAGLWPTDSGQQVTATTEIDAVLPAAIAAFERRTGWLPFLAGAPTTRVFDRPDAGSFLDLQGGLVAIAALDVAGQTLVQNTDYWLRASRAPAPYAPYDGVQFASPALAWGYALTPPPIIILGNWGYCSSLPGDVWDALRAGAAALAAARLASASSGVIRTVVESGFRQSFDLGLLRPARLQEWVAQYETAISIYTRNVN